MERKRKNQKQKRREAKLKTTHTEGCERMQRWKNGRVGRREGDLERVGARGFRRKLFALSYRIHRGFSLLSLLNGLKLLNCSNLNSKASTLWWWLRCPPGRKILWAACCDYQTLLSRIAVSYTSSSLQIETRSNLIEWSRNYNWKYQ